MDHEDCNAWEYSTHSRYQTVADRCAQFLHALRADPASKQVLLADTRPAHSDFFSDVVPSACPYLAGNYRGSDFECLRHYEVQFGGNKGIPALGVLLAIGQFHDELAAAIATLDAVIATGELTPGQQMLRVVQVMAFALQRFFSIHPYANGNGHIGRLLVWVGLARFNMIPKKWWLHTSPPSYGDLIQQHRKGKTRPLEEYLLRAIKGVL
jgi:hypothetical protein